MPGNAVVFEMLSRDISKDFMLQRFFLFLRKSYEFLKFSKKIIGIPRIFLENRLGFSKIFLDNRRNF